MILYNALTCYNILNRMYFFRLEFQVDPSGIGFDLVNIIPITIGTIPLRAVFQTWPNYGSFQPPQDNPTIDTTSGMNYGTNPI